MPATVYRIWGAYTVERSSIPSSVLKGRSALPSSLLAAMSQDPFASL